MSHPSYQMLFKISEIQPSQKPLEIITNLIDKVDESFSMTAQEPDISLGTKTEAHAE